MAGELSPCAALALDAVCGAVTGALEGGALGAAGGAAGGIAGNLECICDHLPSLPVGGSSPGGGFGGYTVNFLTIIALYSLATALYWLWFRHTERDRPSAGAERVAGDPVSASGE